MHRSQIVLVMAALLFIQLEARADDPKLNVLFIISDDLTSRALSCYGNTVCRTPNIDRLAARGTRFTQAYCQGTYCGPSRASLMSGYYPHATGVQGYASPRAAIGDRATWTQHFKNGGYYTARVSKIFHMGVPGGIEDGSHGADDELSWTERFNSQGPEWKAAGVGETLENNPDGSKPVMGGNTFVVVAAEGDDDVHSDGKTPHCTKSEKQRLVPQASPRDYCFAKAGGRSFNTEKTPAAVSSFMTRSTTPNNSTISQTYLRRLKL